MMTRRLCLAAATTLLSFAIPSPGLGQSKSLREEVDALTTEMVAALKKDPATVAQYYTDDASILGGGGRRVGREEIDKYWREATMFVDWSLEVIEVGGDARTPWVRGRSTLVGQSGRQMVTEFIGLLKRQPDGRLRFYVDMFVGGGPVVVRRPPGADGAGG